MLPAKTFLSLSAAACLTALNSVPAVAAQNVSHSSAHVVADLESSHYVLARSGEVIGKLVAYIDRTDGTRDARIRIDFGIRPREGDVVTLPATHLSTVKNQHVLDLDYTQFVNLLTQSAT